MPGGERCRLCASDEGVFLEIFARLPDRTLHQELEDCLSVKVQKNNPLSTKICHKCVFELGQCNEFICKYNKARKLVECNKKSQLKNLCCLCSEPGKKGFLFDLARDTKSPNNPLQKIHECFASDFTESEAGNLMICLPCRYNLDVLFDLKNLSHDATVKLERIIQNNAIVADLPKTETFVVNRVTTQVRSKKLELHTPSDSDSDSFTMARGKSRPKKLNGSKSPIKVEFRTCGKCHTSIGNGIDMYRFHRTGLTVCKPCWMTMDPPKTGKNSKRKRQNSSDEKNTKLCAVFLKDVLTNASFKDDRIYKVEKDDQGNSIYIVTDDNSESDENPRKRLKTGGKEPENGSVMSSDDADVTKNRRPLPKKDAEQESIDSETKRSKRLRSSAQQSDTESVKSGKLTSSLTTRPSKRAKNDSVSDHSHSDGTTARMTRNSISSRKIKSKTPVKREVKSESESSRTRSSKVAKKLNNFRGTKSHNEDSSSSEDGGRRRRQLELAIPIKSPKTELISEVAANERPSRIGTRASLDSNNEGTPTPEKAEFKSPMLRNVKNVASPLSPPGKGKMPAKKVAKSKTANYSLKGKEPFVCKVCNTNYRNRTVGMIHELRHFNQMEIRLQQVNIDEELQKLNENSFKPDSEEQSHDISSTSDASHASDKTEASKLEAANLAPAVDSDLTHVGETDPHSRVSLSPSKDEATTEEADKDTGIIRNSEESSSKVEESVDDSENLTPVDGKPDIVSVAETNTVTDAPEHEAGEAKTTSNDAEASALRSAQNEVVEKDSIQTELDSAPHVDKVEDCGKAAIDPAAEAVDVGDATSESSTAVTLRLEGTQEDEKVDAAVVESVQVAGAEQDVTDKDAAVEEDAVADKDSVAVKEAVVENDAVTDKEAASEKDTACEKDAVFEDVASEKDTVEKDVTPVKDTAETDDTAGKDTAEKDADIETVVSNKLVEGVKEAVEEHDSNADVESETDIKIVDSGSSENSVEQSDLMQMETGSLVDRVKQLPKNEEAAEKKLVDYPTSINSTEDTSLMSNSKEDPEKDTSQNETQTELKDKEAELKKDAENDSTNIAAGILEEVLDMASAAIEEGTKTPNPVPSSSAPVPKNMENISKEISSTEKSSVKGASEDVMDETDLAPLNADMPSLDPIIEADAASQLQHFSSNM